MYDGFGNKTETRFFDNNLLLQNIIVRTSVKGEKQIFVFGQNGEVKQELPAEMASKVLTAPANELATAAGIYEGRKQRKMPIENQQMNKPLTPLPSSAFPIQTPRIITVQPVPAEPEATEPKPNVTVPKTSDTNPTPPKKNGESPALDN